MEGFLFNGLVEGWQEVKGLCILGSEKIEPLSGDGCGGFSSMTRDFVNRMHNESRSIAGAERGLDGVADVRDHSTAGSLSGGRRAGGYVVGNA